MNTGHCEIDGAIVMIEGSKNYYSILNTGSFSITNNGILNVINSEKDRQIRNGGDFSFTVAPGSCLARWTSTPVNPIYYTLTNISPSEATLSVTDNDDSILESGAMTNAGVDLIIQATSATKDVDYYTFSWDNGNNTDTKSPDANGKCKYQMPASDLTISAVLKNKPVPAPDPEPDPDPNPIVYHTVTLPEVEGATTDPVAGNYEVESWDSFRFYLTLLPEYDQSQPVVTTDRGDVLSPRTSDGAYVVKYVRSDVAISIDSIRKNPDPVANEIIREGLHISASGNRVCIETDRSETAIIYNLMGQPVASFEVQPGTNYHWLAKGVYIIAVGDSRCKLSNY